MKGYLSVGVRVVGNPRQRQRGGIRSWQSVRRDIVNHLRGDRECIATMMVDYYGLPQTWPGRDRARSLEGIEEKAHCIESAVQEEVVAEMGHRFDSNRFVPFLVMHEFEGLLFSDCASFSRGISRPDLQVSFQEVRDGFATPEEINDSAITAPSKRIKQLVPSYEKPLFGVLAALEIGLTPIRSECPHFDSWLRRLESLAV